MRRTHASVRWHDMLISLNDFRVLIFIIGLVIQFVSDIAMYEKDMYNEGYLWLSHAFVWLVGGLCFITVDFGTYISYVGRICYPFIVLSVIITEMIGCGTQYESDDGKKYLIERNDRKYTVYDLKIDGLLLMLSVTISLLILIVRDRKGSFYSFGLARRKRALQPGILRMKRNASEAMVEDSLFLLWLINLGCLTYLSFFTWDKYSEYKVIPCALMVTCIALLIKRESDWTILYYSIRSTHVIFMIVASVLLWSTIVSLPIIRGSGHSRWTFSEFVDGCVYSCGILLFIVLDSLSLSSRSFLLRGTLPLVFLIVSGQFFVFYTLFFIYFFPYFVGM